jgi:hypothetical protein
MENIKKPFKKGNVCVLVDPVTKNRIWLPLEDVEIKINGTTHNLGKYLEQQEENKLEKKEFEQYKLKTNKILKEFSKILKVVVGQNELNGLDINEIIDTMEGKQNEKE